MERRGERGRSLAYRSRADSLTSILGGATWPISVSRFDDSRSNYRERRGGIEEPGFLISPSAPLPHPLHDPIMLPRAAPAMGYNASRYKGLT